MSVTEEQARGIIEREGGTWRVPVMPELTPELERIRDLRAQMQANTDSVPRPKGIEHIKGMGTVVPYWCADPDMVLWTAGNRERVWRFDYATDSWVLAPEIDPDFIGTRETGPMTEDEAKEYVEEHGGIWVAPVRKDW